METLRNWLKWCCWFYDGDKIKMLVLELKQTVSNICHQNRFGLMLIEGYQPWILTMSHSLWPWFLFILWHVNNDIFWFLWFWLFRFFLFWTYFFFPWIVFEAFASAFWYRYWRMFLKLQINSPELIPDGSLERQGT